MDSSVTMWDADSLGDEPPSDEPMIDEPLTDEPLSGDLKFKVLKTVIMAFMAFYEYGNGFHEILEQSLECVDGTVTEYDDARAKYSRDALSLICRGETTPDSRFGSRVGGTMTMAELALRRFMMENPDLVGHKDEPNERAFRTISEQLNASGMQLQPNQVRPIAMAFALAKRRKIRQPQIPELISSPAKDSDETEAASHSTGRDKAAARQAVMEEWDASAEGRGLRADIKDTLCEIEATDDRVMARELVDDLLGSFVCSAEEWRVGDTEATKGMLVEVLDWLE